MKHLLIIFLSVFALACTEVSFPTHQPKGEKILTEIPPELRGKYITPDADSVDLRDTLLITSRGYSFSDKNSTSKSTWLEWGELSDSLILKKYQGYYFFSFKEKNQWLLRVLKRERNGDLSFRMFAIDGAGKDKLLWELEKELPVERIQIDSDEKYYRIDPGPKKLIQLVKKNKFWEESKLKRVN